MRRVCYRFITLRVHVHWTNASSIVCTRRFDPRLWRSVADGRRSTRPRRQQYQLHDRGIPDMYACVGPLTAVSAT